jgi:hypothetical protein
MQSLCRFMALVFLAAATAPANVDPRYPPAPAPPERPVLPNTPPPAMQKYPPSWYYNPYTQGIAPLPQGGGS